MIMRPSYIYWMRLAPDGKEWLSWPEVVQERWGAEEIGGRGLVHWHSAMHSPSSKEIASQLASALSEVSNAEGFDLGLSVLFIWDGIDSNGSFLEACFRKTEEYLLVFRQVIDANIVQYQQLQDARFEILIRLPRIGHEYADADLQRASQKEWLKKMQDLVTPPEGQRVSVSRFWILGGNNVDLQHKRGITVASQQETDQLTAEVVTFWLESNLDSILNKVRIGSSAYLSVGVGRLLIETGACKETLSSRMGSRLLLNVLSDEARSPDPEEHSALMARLAIGPDVRGIDAESLGELFLNPRKLLSDSPEYTVVDLGGQLLFEFEIDSTDVENVEKSMELPSTIMLQGRMLILSRLFEGMKRVRECRNRAFNAIAEQLSERVGDYTKRTGDRHWKRLRDRFIGWRGWMIDQVDRTKAISSGLMRTDGQSSSPIESYFNALFHHVEGPQKLVQEDRPDPNVYASKLEELLKNRPLTEAFIARSAIGACLCTWGFWQVLNLVGARSESWFFAEPIIWLFVALLPVVWGLSTWLHLRKLRKRRKNALHALMISIIKNGKGLFRDFIEQEMVSFYNDLVSFIGYDEDLYRTSSRGPELEKVAANASHGSSRTGELLKYSLLTRAGRARSMIERASESLAKASFSPGIADTKWVLNIAGSDAAMRFPFLTEPIGAVASNQEPPLEEIYQGFQSDLQPLDQTWSFSGTEESAIGVLADRTRMWASANGYRYLSKESAIKLLSFLSKDDPDLVDCWKAFLERAAHPFFSLSHGAVMTKIGVVHPEGETSQLEKLLEHYPNRLGSYSWTGTSGIVACAIQGPIDSDELNMLPIRFPDPSVLSDLAERVGTEIEEI
jgi:hypothetical protein